MTTRKRLPRTPKELERSLIASARLDVRPAPQAVRKRILAALTAAGALGTGTAVASATSGALGGLAIVKWIATAAVVGAAGVGGYAAVKRAHGSAANVDRTHDSPIAVVQSNQLPVTSSPPASEERVTSTAPPPEATPSRPAAQRHRTTAPPKAPSVAKIATDMSSLEGEVAALDRARASLAAGDAARTIDLLDGYGQAFPQGALRQEATYLRIQTLSKSGQGAAARALAARFLADHPESPHASQLQHLLAW
jgi:TolA-binding protein